MMRKELEYWKRYEKVRGNGKYNMITEATSAMREAGLTEDEYKYVQENYHTLQEEVKSQQMDAREAKEKLSELRFKYQHYELTAEEVYEQAQPYLKIYNDKAKEIAKKYGVKPKTLPNNLIFW